MTTIAISDNGDHIDKSMCPVSIQEFGITTIQCGISEPPSKEDDNKLVLKRYAKDVA